ncbi:hypothetical protein ABMC89_00560 [Sulfitobacter sp. HNIBRBA3233]|uniref:hypothetical protein n=1 Tax=Sulfitobacter marinivivus TaxID=3158558 RepID=UPI0032DF6015
MRFALLILLFLAACGRPLTDSERAFARGIHGDTLDLDAVRLVEGAPTRAVTFRRKPRPRTTCRELIFPPVEEEKIVTSKPAAMALWNRVLFDRDWFLEDYLPDYPDRIGLVAAMLLSHELTHIWQWQNRAVTGYTPLRAASEHNPGDDPYLFELEDRRFLDFGYEQQGSIVEELVCCRALNPQGARTQRLHALVRQAMPVAPLPQSPAYDVGLPWDGVDLENICT